MAVGQGDKSAMNSDQRPEVKSEIHGLLLHADLKSEFSSSRAGFRKKTVTSDARSLVSWCPSSNLIVSTSRNSIKASRNDSHGKHDIAVNILDPEHPTQHFFFKIPTDNGSAFMTHLEWSPVSYSGLILTVDSLGNASVWSKSSKRVSVSVSDWQCDTSWRQENSVFMKWLHPPHKYCLPPEPPLVLNSFEEKFLRKDLKGPNTSRWHPGNFPVIASVNSSGSFQLRWKPFQTKASTQLGGDTWHTSEPLNPFFAFGGVVAADVCLSQTGSLFLAAVPRNCSASVSVFEVLPSEAKPHGIEPVTRSNPTRISALGLKMFQFPANPLPLIAVASSNLRFSELQIDEQIVRVVFSRVDPEFAIFTLSYKETEQKLLWTVRRWESSHQSLASHPFFDKSTFSGPDNSVKVTKWKAVAEREFSCQIKQRPSEDDSITAAELQLSPFLEEISAQLPNGDVHVLHSSDLSVISSFPLNSEAKPGLSVTFSPTGFAFAAAYDSLEKKCNAIRVYKILDDEVEGASWDRQLADRVELCWVTGISCWDCVALRLALPEETFGPISKLLSLLDDDFHSIPSAPTRIHFRPIYDRFKCMAVQSGTEPESRTLFIDIQTRLLLDQMAHCVETSLLSNAFFLTNAVTPWNAENVQAMGQESMAVVPALVATVEPYVDAILDITLHYITRMRRYIGFQKMHNEKERASSSQLQGGQPLPTRVNLNTSALVGHFLLSDKSYLHRLCSLTLFCWFYRKKYGSALQPSASEADGRSGKGNGGVGYTWSEVRMMFSVIKDLCMKTNPSESKPATGADKGSTALNLHFPDGVITMVPEELEPWIHKFLQVLPRPRVADSGGLLLRELELLPPAMDAGRRMSEPLLNPDSLPALSQAGQGPHWGPNPRLIFPHKRRLAERDIALGFRADLGLAPTLGLIGMRRDAVLASWRKLAEADWKKCVRCGRQTAVLPAQARNEPGRKGEPSEVRLWNAWAAQWTSGCPICGGRWTQLT